jgi:hypothetical protein
MLRKTIQQIDKIKRITFTIPETDTTFFDNIYFRGGIRYIKILGDEDNYYKYLYIKNTKFLTKDNYEDKTNIFSYYNNAINPIVIYLDTTKINCEKITELHINNENINNEIEIILFKPRKIDIRLRLA